jgi:diaminopimelate decarboxylase
MNHALESALAHFACQGNELTTGGVTMSSLAEKYGTPLYIYDQNIIRKKFQFIRSSMPDELKIYYAVKANPNTEIIRLMGTLYDGFDVASAGEAEQVLKAGIAPEKISFAGPGKSVAELRYVIDRQIGALSMESEQEFDHIRTIARVLDKTASVLVRVNPDFDLTQSGMRMGGGPKQFGVDSERVPSLLDAIIKEKRVHLKGIHIFAGSQNLNAESLLQTFAKILAYAVNVVAETGIHLEQLNMGGGFGIPYFSHEQELDLDVVGKGLTELLGQYGSKLGHPRFIIELGRYLVGECGVYLSRILYRKISRGEVFLVTDGGMHHHLAASGNFGQSLVRRPVPMTVANRQGTSLEKVHVTGPLCTPLDTFGYVDLPCSNEGDLIAVLNSGAYGYTASPLLFLGHPSPGEIMVE